MSVSMRTKLSQEPESSSILISHLRLPSYTDLLARSRLHATLISASNSVISWISTLLIFALPNQGEQSGLKAGITVAALLQTVLVLLYWKAATQHSRLLAVKLRITPKHPFWKSLFFCALECVWHLLVPVDYFGVQRTGLVSSQVFCVLALLRNHHSLRYLYWASRCSDTRSRFMLTVIGMDLRAEFLFKSMLSDYPLRLILGVFLSIAVLAGLFTYSSDLSPTRDLLDAVWNNVWMMVVTQTTIGYGEVKPMSFLGQMMTLLGCFCGIGALGLLNPVVGKGISLDMKEVTLAAEILHSRHIDNSKNVFATLLQRWWRLVRVRKLRKTSGKLAASFSKQLLVYRKTSSTAQKVKETVFEKQISNFDIRFEKSVSVLQSAIGNVRRCCDRTLAILETQRSIKMKCWQLLGSQCSLKSHRRCQHHYSTESGDYYRLRSRKQTRIKVRSLKISQTRSLSAVIGRMLRKTDSLKSSSKGYAFPVCFDGSARL